MFVKEDKEIKKMLIFNIGEIRLFLSCNFPFKKRNPKFNEEYEELALFIEQLTRIIRYAEKRNSTPFEVKVQVKHRKEAADTLSRKYEQKGLNEEVKDFKQLYYDISMFYSNISKKLDTIEHT